ncbi:hypothetical protein C2S51_026958 [Perilla frutescens var. frutescens]|nr:hypothetical protein C2S51_026958 [Perilla frutescens var. frutescens]
MNITTAGDFARSCKNGFGIGLGFRLGYLTFAPGLHFAGAGASDSASSPRFRASKLTDKSSSAPALSFQVSKTHRRFSTKGK